MVIHYDIHNDIKNIDDQKLLLNCVFAFFGMLCGIGFALLFAHIIDKRRKEKLAQLISEVHNYKNPVQGELNTD